LHFVFEDGTEETISVAPGEDVDISQVPAIPEKEGYVGEWEGLEEDDLSNVVFDKTYEVAYNSYEKTIQSEACRENDKPVLLVQGTFTSKAEVVLEKSDASFVDVDGTLIEVWDVSLNENEYVTAGRFLIPDGCDGEKLQVYVCGSDGTWSPVSSTVDGSYLVFEWDGEGTQIAVTETSGVNMVLVVGVAGIAIVLILVGFGFTRKKKNKK
ncbi:MAG: hypothetical protein U0L12_00290, partial [Ruminococcus sp.]|nr:hypothetical protein [Ruminococcus sp.]